MPCVLVSSPEELAPRSAGRVGFQALGLRIDFVGKPGEFASA